jgi:hypothetical protein
MTCILCILTTCILCILTTCILCILTTCIPQYLGSKDDRTACLLKCFGWLGTEEEYWNYDIPSDGRITVYAETFENQTVMGTTWSIKGLTRPEFSDPDGKVGIEKR